MRCLMSSTPTGHEQQYCAIHLRFSALLNLGFHGLPPLVAASLAESTSSCAPSGSAALLSPFSWWPSGVSAEECPNGVIGRGRAFQDVLLAALVLPQGVRLSGRPDIVRGVWRGWLHEERDCVCVKGGSTWWGGALGSGKKGLCGGRGVRAPRRRREGGATGKGAQTSEASYKECINLKMAWKSGRKAAQMDISLRSLPPTMRTSKCSARRGDRFEIMCVGVPPDPHPEPLLIRSGLPGV